VVDLGRESFLANPGDAARDVYFPLRSLNVVNLVPVDLNAILQENEVVIAGFLNQRGNRAQAQEWSDLAAKRSAAMYAVSGGWLSSWIRGMRSGPRRLGSGGHDQEKGGIVCEKRRNSMAQGHDGRSVAVMITKVC
jgi:hypothetical protein